MKRTRIGLGIVVMLGVVAMGSVATGSANAQTALRGGFHLDHPVRWTDTTLPAGDYTVELESVGKPGHLIVGSADAKKRVFVMPTSIRDAEQGGTEMQLTQQNGEWVVETLNLPQLGIQLKFAGLSAKDRNELAKKNTAVPVTTAGN